MIAAGAKGFGVLSVVAALGGVTHALQHGVLGVGALCCAVGMIYLYGVRPIYRVLRQTSKIHGVLLGDGEHEPLDRRLSRIEESSTDTNDRLVRVERSMEVIAAQDRKDVLDVLAAAKSPEHGKAA